MDEDKTITDDGFHEGETSAPGYSARRKIYSYFVVLCTIGIMVSGPVMVFKHSRPSSSRSQPVHFISVFVIVAWLFIPRLHGCGLSEEESFLLHVLE
jgi:hypothetical protein